MIKKKKKKEKRKATSGWVQAEKITNDRGQVNDLDKTNTDS